MADITSGTVYQSPIGDFTLGTIQLASAASIGDVVGVQAIVGSKVDGIAFASTDSGTCTISSTSGSITIGTSNALNVFFVALGKGK